MKATRQNLYNLWFISKLYNLLEYWDSVKFFIREWTQRVQNYKSDMTRDDLEKGFDNYLNWLYSIDINKKQRIWNTVILDIVHWLREKNGLKVFIFNPMTGMIGKRVIKKIAKKDNKTCIKVQNEWHEVEMDILK